MVTVESLSPQPFCPNQVLIYNCQLEFPSLALQWDHSEFGTLVFTASEDAVGVTRNTSDGRVVANLTKNEGTMSHRMMASTLTIHPPLNDLNGINLNDTNVECKGFELQGGEQRNVTKIDLTGKWLQYATHLRDYTLQATQI